MSDMTDFNFGKNLKKVIYWEERSVFLMGFYKYSITYLLLVAHAAKCEVPIVCMRIAN